MIQNNSISMKTVVETYIIEETQELIYDNEKLDQWNKHVIELGLSGQTKIQVKDKSPIPFLHMKKSLVNVFSTLCPRMVDVKEYDKTPIPVELLDLIALSVKEEYFNRIQIWYDDEKPDPAIIGFVGDWVVYDKSYNRLSTFKTEKEATEQKDVLPGYYTYHFNEVGKYLIGRWADVKASFEELTERARKLFIAQKKDEFNAEITKYKRRLDDLDAEAISAFGHDAKIIDNLPF